MLCISACYAEEWTIEELQSANTAADANYMTSLEKNVILYVNLARMYPKKFARIEVEPYDGPEGFAKESGFDAYKQSLLRDLYRMNPVKAYKPSYSLYQSAYCWAEESGRLGITGHTRVSCTQPNIAECCSYGVSSSIDVVLQLLIDAGVPSLGHRINCLNSSYSKIGVSQMPHQKWGNCTVLNMIW